MKKHSINSSSISSLHALLSFVMWCLRRRPLLRVRRKTSSSTTTLSSAPLVRFNFPFCDMTKKKCYRILLVVDRNAIAASWGLRPMPFLSHTHERTMLACARHAITVAAAAAAVYASHKLYSLQSNVNSTILPEEIACIASRIIIFSSHFFFTRFFFILRCARHPHSFLHSFTRASFHSLRLVRRWRRAYDVWQDSSSTVRVQLLLLHPRRTSFTDDKQRWQIKFRDNQVRDEGRRLWGWGWIGGDWYMMKIQRAKERTEGTHSDEKKSNCSALRYTYIDHIVLGIMCICSANI